MLQPKKLPALFSRDYEAETESWKVVLLGSLGNTSCANGVVIRTPLHELDWIGNTHAESSMVVWEIKVDPQLSQEHKYGRNGDIDVVWCC